MAAEILRVRYGQAATATLAATVRELQNGDPLAPVTIVITDHATGLIIRRQLASSARGLAAVDVVTILDLARSLSMNSPRLVGRRPVSDAVVLAAARRLLAERPGVFGRVADHPSVERSVVDAHRKLREIHPDSLNRLAAEGDMLADLVALHRSLVELLKPTFHDESERADIAAAALDDRSVKPSPIILHLPNDLAASEHRLLSALTKATRVVAIVGDADSPNGSVSANPLLGALAATLGVEPPVGDTAGTRVDLRVASVPEQDEAARYAIRRIIEATKRGTPLDRIALIHPPSTDDARLIQDRLSSAGITFYSSGVRRLEETITGRFLVGLLNLPCRDLRRNDVLAWMENVPLWDPSHELVPTRTWTRLAIRAGVVGGLEDWSFQLSRLATELEDEATEEVAEEARPWLIERLVSEAEMARRQISFMERLDQSLEELACDSSWSGRCRRVRSLIRDHLGGHAAREDWPADELIALEEIGAILDALSELDEIEPSPPEESFRNALTAELQRPIGRSGQTGVGVQVVGIDRTVGLEADLVIVVGLAEGSLPTRPPADPLLTDSRRVSARTGLPTRHDHAARQQHAFLAALTSASEQIVLIQPRGDLRRSGDRPMSRLLLAELEARAGNRPEPEQLHRFTADWFDHVASFTDALNRDEPSTPQEYDLATAVRGGTDAVNRLRNSDVIVDRGIRMQEERHGSSLSRFEGNLSGVDLGLLNGEVSATRLETWVDCPFAFFAEYVLGVRPLDESSDRTDLAPLVRGSIIHRALYRLVDESLTNGSNPGAGEAWTAAHRARAAELLHEECNYVEARGEAAHPRFWPTIRARLAAELDDFLVLDSSFRAHFGSRPIAAELRFGGESALVVTLANGRNIRFRGAIDRIDETADGEFVVVDAKTGAPGRYKSIPNEHFPNGSFLQLPIYALAAATEDRKATHAAYAFVGKVSESDRHLGYDIDDEVIAGFRRVLESVVHGIERGAFPHHPPESDRPETHRCPYCSPDGLDARRVRTARSRKAGDPILALHADHITTDFMADPTDNTNSAAEPEVNR
ncbi:MAG TPA: hypothetical protein DCR10_11545 [Acidimicrobiaceae bacterium]|nr:hypothetical protein [Acidimicrobiaceae bacterium]